MFCFTFLSLSLFHSPVLYFICFSGKILSVSTFFLLSLPLLLFFFFFVIHISFLLPSWVVCSAQTGGCHLPLTQLVLLCIYICTLCVCICWTGGHPYGFAAGNIKSFDSVGDELTQRNIKHFLLIFTDFQWCITTMQTYFLLNFSLKCHLQKYL